MNRERRDLPAEAVARGRSPVEWGMGGLALLALATFIVYQPAWNAGFVWDDDAHLTKEALRSWGGLWRIWSEVGATQQYYPLLHSVFWLEHRLWGENATCYHLANIALHVTAAGLFWALLRRLTVPGAFVAAVVFALHPVHVESVAWITEQKNTLSTTFYLAAAWVYLRFDDDRSRRHYWLALALFVAALLTKSVTATLPGALLVIAWWKRGRIDWKRDVLPLLPWFVVGASAGLLTAWVERAYIGAEGAEYEMSWLQRVLLAGRVAMFYLGKLAWPVDLAFIYPRWSVSPSVAAHWLPLLGALAVTALAWAFRQRSRAPLAAWLYFVGSLFPVLGFLNVYPFRYSFVADHFQYVASLGPIALAAAGVWLARRRPPTAPEVPVAALALFVLVGAVLTFRQARHYRDAETLWRATVAVNPGAYLAHNNLGVLLIDAGRPEEALAHYRASLAIKPDLAETHFNRAVALMTLPGRTAEAIAAFEEGLRYAPNDAQAHVNLAALLSHDPVRRVDALAHYQAALRLKPDSALAHDNLGFLLGLVPGRLTEAIEHGQAAVRLQPDSPEMHFNLATNLARQSHTTSDAIRHFGEAVRLKPDHAKARLHLGVLLARDPAALAEAIGHYRAALEVEPGSAILHNNLAVALIDAGQPHAALAHFEEAVRLDPGFNEARNNLARLRALLAPPRPSIFRTP